MITEMYDIEHEEFSMKKTIRGVNEIMKHHSFFQLLSIYVLKMKEVVVFNGVYYLKLNDEAYFRLVNSPGRNWRMVMGPTYHSHLANMPLYRIDLTASKQLTSFVSTSIVCVSINGMKLTSPVAVWNDGSTDVLCVEGSLKGEELKDLSKTEEKTFCFVGNEIATSWGSGEESRMAEICQLHKLKANFLNELSKAVRRRVRSAHS